MSTFYQEQHCLQLAEVIVRLRVACQTIHRVQDYSICSEEVYSLLQTFIATVHYTLQIDKWVRNAEI